MAEKLPLHDQRGATNSSLEDFKKKDIGVERSEIEMVARSPGLLLPSVKGAEGMKI